jgi:hypothetical protein
VKHQTLCEPTWAKVPVITEAQPLLKPRRHRSRMKVFDSVCGAEAPVEQLLWGHALNG